MPDSTIWNNLQKAVSEVSIGPSGSSEANAVLSGIRRIGTGQDLTHIFYNDATADSSNLISGASGFRSEIFQIVVSGVGPSNGAINPAQVSALALGEGTTASSSNLRYQFWFGADEGFGPLSLDLWPHPWLLPVNRPLSLGWQGSVNPARASITVVYRSRPITS